MALAYALLYLPSFNSVLCPCPPWCPLYLHLCSASQGFCSHFLPCCWQLSRLSVLPPLANVLLKFMAFALQQSVDCMQALLHCILHCMPLPLPSTPCGASTSLSMLDLLPSRDANSALGNYMRMHPAFLFCSSKCKFCCGPTLGRIHPASLYCTCHFH